MAVKLHTKLPNKFPGAFVPDRQQETSLRVCAEVFQFSKVVSEGSTFILEPQMVPEMIVPSVSGQSEPRRNYVFDGSE